MSEEEIIKEINIIKETIIDILKIDTENYIEDIYNIDTIQFKAIEGLLDLYNKEKLNSLNLSEQLNKEKEKNKNSVSKDEIETLLQDVDNTKFINKHVKGMYLYDNLKCLLEE